MPEVFAGSAAYPKPTPGPVLSIGNFDGVHRGHQYLLGKLVERARVLNVPACVYTFDPPPRVVLAPQQHQPRILSWPDKVRLLGEFGVDHVVVERFTKSFAQHPPTWFVDEVLSRRIGAREIVVGYDFRFGKARAGDVEMLRARMKGVDVQQVEAWAMEDGVVSSTRVREAVRSGEVVEATRLLGRLHRVRGTVVPGEQRGRKIGFPTANIETDAELVPARGVYAVMACVDGGAWMPAVANLGIRPTFDGRRFLIEVHLLDQILHLYGHELEVGFVEKLRAEQRFEGIDALAAQIRADVVAARACLEKH
jgi:riboflavin kinase/FMN adenylyltransferase